MGSPKPEKPEPSKNEIMSAAVAKADYDRYKKLYAPLLRRQRDESRSGDADRIAQSRANADVMQAAANRPTVTPTGQVANTDGGGLVAQALQGQAQDARTKAALVNNNRKVQTLNAANKMGQTASQGLSTLARLDANTSTQKLKNTMQVEGSKFAALGQLVGTGMAVGASKGMFGAGAQDFVRAQYGMDPIDRTQKVTT